MQRRNFLRGFLGALTALTSIPGARRLSAAVKKSVTTSNTLPPTMDGQDPFVAEIAIFPFNFAPRGWANCSGQLLPISQNTALFSLLGTFYGGDGKSTFALPDLQGSFPIGQGQCSASGTQRFIGESGGVESVTLLISEIPAHQHHRFVRCDKNYGTSESPANKNFARDPSGTARYSNNNNSSIYPVTGGSLPHNNMPPYLTLNLCISLQGVFPSRP